jgi:four helix bundle protein
MLHTFENLEVWKRSAKLAADINIAIQNHTNYALKDQISRSSISIPSNIAEGSERDSTNDFIRFLRMSKGSCAELRTQLYINQKIAQETGANNLPETPTYIQETKEILAMLQGLIQKLQQNTSS